MRVQASFNPAPLKRKMQNRARGFSRDLPEELRRAGRLIAVSLATSAQPYGIDDGARQRGESATAGDIRRCYATPADVYAAFSDPQKAAGFWKLISAGKFAQAQSWMQQFCSKFANKDIKPFDDGAAHKNARNNRGRVSKRQEPAFVVQTTRDLFAYIKNEVQHVGEGKAGWAACAKILGGARGLPQWITRHAGKLSPGTVIENKNEKNPTITMRNEVRYAKDILSGSDKQEALRIGIDRLTKGCYEAEKRARAAAPLG